MMTRLDVNGIPVLSAGDPDLDTITSIARDVLPKGTSQSPTARWRWIHKGRNGVMLPVIHLGNAYYCTRAVFVAWLDATAIQRGGMSGRPQRKKRSEKQTAELKKSGLLG
jgi:hypothetical protein